MTSEPDAHSDSDDAAAYVIRLNYGTSGNMCGGLTDDVLQGTSSDL